MVSLDLNAKAPPGVSFRVLYLVSKVIVIDALS